MEIATHDHKVINKMINDIIIPKKIESDRFEFQFLKGVQNAYSIEKKLMAENYPVRYYMPVEIENGDGIPYMQRRLIANPGMVFVAAKNMMQQLAGYVKGK